MHVLTKTFEEKTVRQMSLAIDVEEMESELSEAESIFGRLRLGLQVEGWHNRPRRQSVKSGRGSESEKWRTEVITSSYSMTRTIWSSFNRDRCRTAQWSSFSRNRCRTAQGSSFSRNKRGTAHWSKSSQCQFHVYGQEVSRPE